MIAIPIIAAILYLVGGQWWKIARWLLIGTAIFFIAIFNAHPWWSIFAVLTYFIATNVFSYGDNMWTSKLFGRWVSMGLSGLMYGLASMVILGVFWGLVQGVIGLVSFTIIKYYDDKGIIHNPFVELARGFLGTVLFFFA